ncbi:MAG TPA: FAD:protein FMN transferase [Burkholderiales bacterium]|jgi:thiamine biosynthesis lipoprotein|nr:FAD:protein FMN transferase [Burkholderiales bacterium]
MAALALLLIAAVASAPEMVHGKRFVMGTVFDVLAYGPRPQTERAIQDALSEIERLDAILSHYKAASELRRLPRAARDAAATVSPELYEVLAESLRFSRLSSGAFDVTVAPLVRAWRSEEQPDEATLQRLRSCTGWEKIRLEPPNRVRILSDCLELDLGGIGKGYAADRAARVLQQAGVRSALVNAGSSSILALEPPPGCEGWAVDLPRGAGAIQLARSSLSTSEQAGGHIIDPASGRPASSSWAVTVVAHTATAADALSTALLVLGPERSGEIVARLGDAVQVRWIDPAGRIR